MKLNDVLTEVREHITPLSETISHLEAQAKEVVRLLAKQGIQARIGGSLAKGTVIRKEKPQDVDVFITCIDESEARTIGKKLLQAKLPGTLREVHGSREYYQLKSKGVVIELVPVVPQKKKEFIENVTDFSLDHVAYVREAIRKRPELADEIRLAKAFCTAQRVYGAESYIHGFSGYALEVLVIYSGSFEKFLKLFTKEKEKYLFDPKRQFSTANEVLREINGSKLLGPVVVVDPTYKYRNVTAGLGCETLTRFRQSAIAFLRNPSMIFFKPVIIDENELRRFASKKRARLVIVLLQTDRQSGDIAGTKMKKFFDFFISEFKRKKQKILRTEFDYDGTGKEAKGYVVLKESPFVKVRGPSANMSPTILAAFKKAKGPSVFETKGSLWYTEHVTVENVFETTKKVGKDIGAWGTLQE